jgi:hypothetical protein
MDMADAELKVILPNLDDDIIRRSFVWNITNMKVLLIL